MPIFELEEEEKNYQLITYEDTVEFSYVLENGKKETIKCEITFIWKERLTKFFAKFGHNKPYNIRNFRFEDQYNFYVQKFEKRVEEQLETIEKSIANKSKFGFQFSEIKQIDASIGI